MPALDSVDRIIILHSTESTNARAASRHIAALQKSPRLPRVDMIEIVASEGEAANRARILAALKACGKDRPLLAVAGGDGALHYAMRALLSTEMPPAFRPTPVVPLPLGYANDFFHMTQRNDYLHRLERIFTSSSAHTVAIHPLEWIYQRQGRTVHDYALCYGTIGVTADAAARLNAADHRARRKEARPVQRPLLDYTRGFKSIWFPPLLRLQRGAKAEPFVELQAVNGSTMGTYARYSARLSHDTFFFGISRMRSPGGIALTSLRMKFGRAPGRLTRGPVQFTLQNSRAVPAQLDGEDFLMDDGPVCIRRAAQPILVWATKDL